MDLKAIVDAIVLGIVEGVTEFLPVSSTAHVLLASRLLGFDSAGKAFDVLIQFGAILALLAVYATRLRDLLVALPRDRRTQHFALAVIVAFLPAAILGAIFHDVITGVLFNSVVLIAVALILGGIVLLLIDRLQPAIGPDSGLVSGQRKQPEVSRASGLMWDPLESTCRHASLSIL